MFDPGLYLFALPPPFQVASALPPPLQWRVLHSWPLLTARNTTEYLGTKAALRMAVEDDMWGVSGPPAMQICLCEVTADGKLVVLLMVTFNMQNRRHLEPHFCENATGLMTLAGVTEILYSQMEAYQWRQSRIPR